MMVSFTCIVGITPAKVPVTKTSSAALLSKGIRLCLVDTIRGSQNSQDPRLNTLSKLNCIFGCLEADEKGFDEGIMLM